MLPRIFPHSSVRQSPRVLLLVETSHAYGRGGVPIVEVCTDPPPCGTHGVFADHDRAGKLAAEHLLDRGLRHMAFYCTDRIFWAEQRGAAFVRYLEQRGCGCEVIATSSLGSANIRPRDLHQQAAAWLSSLPKPCGIFCASDLYAARLSNVCRECAIPVPEQVAILGADNDTVMCSVRSPPLSSIDLNTPRIGYEAAKLLAQLMAGEPVARTTVRVEPSGVVTRQSTDTLAIADAELARAMHLIREEAFTPLDEVAASTGQLFGELDAADWSRRYRAHIELTRREPESAKEAASRLSGIDAGKPATPHLIWLAAADANPATKAKIIDLTRNGDASIRSTAVRALARFGASGEVFLAALADVSPTVRHAAIVGLFDQTKDLPFEPVVKAAGKDATFIRQAAAFLLARRASVAQLTSLCETLPT
jgi:hypothetical protein